MTVGLCFIVSVSSRTSWLQQFLLVLREGGVLVGCWGLLVGVQWCGPILCVLVSIVIPVQRRSSHVIDIVWGYWVFLLWLPHQL